MKMLQRQEGKPNKGEESVKNQRKKIEKKEESYENAPNKPMRFKKIFDASSAPKEEPKPARKKSSDKDGRKDSKKDERAAERTIREMDRAEILTQSRAEVHQDLRVQLLQMHLCR